MNRKEIVRISNEANAGKFTTKDAVALIMEYCIVEHNKPEKDTNNLISVLLMNHITLYQFAQQALEYYIRKFTVYSVCTTSNSFGYQKNEVILYY